MNLIGNERIRTQIEIAAKSAIRRNTALPHILFSGAAGCGKTSTARKLAHDIRVDFLSVLPDSLKTVDDVWHLMERLNYDSYNEYGDRTGPIKPSIVFIDEIHNLSMKTQETLGVAMENWALESKSNGKLIWLPYFTIVGATTNDGILSKPFRDRFKLRFLFKPYTFEESEMILSEHCRRLGIGIDSMARSAIARRGRGVPRILVGYLERARDRMLYEDDERVTLEMVEETFRSLNIDKEGLTEAEIKILMILFEAKEAIGLENLSVLSGEAHKTIQNSVEPYLIQKGFLLRTGKGRKITEKGGEYLLQEGYYGKKNIRREIDATYVRK